MENVFTVGDNVNESMSLPPEKMLSRSPSEHAFQRFLQLEATASVDHNSSPSPPVTAAAASSPASHHQQRRPQPETDAEEYREFLKSRLYLACAAVASSRGNCPEPRDSSAAIMLPEGSGNDFPKGPERLELSTQKKMDAKRERKMLCNRESARRCRRRKDAHITEMEAQVSELKDENSSLLKRLTEVSQKHNDAAVENRILKADVETLRTKVKIAEEILKGGVLPIEI